MSTTQQPEALRLAQMLEALGWRSVDKDLRVTAAELRRLHAENTTLQQGYAAARLEIESLRARSAEPAGEYPPLPTRPEPDGFLTIKIIGRDVEVNAYRDSTMEAFARAAVDADRAMRAAQSDLNLSCKSTQKRLATQWGFVPAGAQQPGAGTWTPLPGTLPEPGKPVLLDIGKKYPIRAMWVQKFTLPVGMEDDSGFGEYEEATDSYYCPEGWYEWNEHEECHWRVDKTPVAWCELPPKEQK